MIIILYNINDNVSKGILAHYIQFVQMCCFQFARADRCDITINKDSTSTFPVMFIFMRSTTNAVLPAKSLSPTMRSMKSPLSIVPEGSWDKPVLSTNLDNGHMESC